MPYHLTTPQYDVKAVEFATNGYATSANQRNWLQRGVLVTAGLTPEARAGKPRLWPLLAVYEQAILSHAAQAGIPFAVINAALRHRVRIVLDDPADDEDDCDDAGGWAGDDLRGVAELGLLPEFLDTSTSWYWVIWHDGRGQVQASFPIVATEDPRPGAISIDAALSVAGARARGGAISTVINVTRIVEAVNAKLYEYRRWEQK